MTSESTSTLGPQAAGSGAENAPAFAGTACALHVVHVIHRLDVGGMENGLVNLINTLPAERYHHTIICLTDFTEFRLRIRRPDVEIYALHKRPGKDLGVYLRLWRLLRRLRPDVVHTRNMAALECQLPAWLAGVPVRVHGEHGWDVLDLHGTSGKYRLLRRAYRFFVHRYIAVSRHIARYLSDVIGVPESRLAQIYNGVDTDRFHPADSGRIPLPVAGFAPDGVLVIGTVGRFEAVKDQLTLLRGFLQLLESVPEARNRLRLVMVGDGSLMPAIQQEISAAGAGDVVWLPGARDDVPEILRGMDVFVLPSIAEGVSNTILEAMASGLPVVATRVGGNPELVADGQTGTLVPPGQPTVMAEALRRYVNEPALVSSQGEAARRQVLSSFSLESMMAGYMVVYEELRRQRLVAR